MGLVRDWDTNENVWFVQKRKPKKAYGNYKLTSGFQDVRRAYSKIIDNDDIPRDALKYADSFIKWVKWVIEEYFDSVDGTYWIKGRQQDKSKHSRMIYNVTVLKFEYMDGEVVLRWKRSYGKKWGKDKSKRTIYRAFKEMPELKLFLS